MVSPIEGLFGLVRDRLHKVEDQRLFLQLSLTTPSKAEYGVVLLRPGNVKDAVLHPDERGHFRQDAVPPSTGPATPAEDG